MSETGPEDPQGNYLRWEQKPAIGRRGVIVSVVGPILIAAVGFGVISLISDGSETQATTVRVPTSSWKAGQPGGDETIRGQISVDDHRCVYLADVAGQQVWPVWPAGYYARLDAAGHISLYDGGNHLVAREGETVQATGAAGSPAAYVGETCLPDDDKVAVIQSEVSEVG